MRLPALARGVAELALASTSARRTCREVTLSLATAALNQEVLSLHPSSVVLGGAGAATTAGPWRWSCMLTEESLDSGRKVPGQRDSR